MSQHPHRYSRFVDRPGSHLQRAIGRGGGQGRPRGGANFPPVAMSRGTFKRGGFNPRGRRGQLPPGRLAVTAIQDLLDGDHTMQNGRPRDTLRRTVPSLGAESLRSLPTGSHCMHVTILNPATCDKAFLISSLSGVTGYKLIPVRYHHDSGATDGPRVTFYILGTTMSVAHDLRNANRKVVLPNGSRMSLKVNSVELENVESQPLTPDLASKLVTRMSERYNISTKSLNMSSFVVDEKLAVEEGIVLNLGRATVMQVLVETILKYIPEIERLELSANFLTDTVALKPLADQLQHLHTLDLSRNLINDISLLAPLKGCSKTLRTFYFHGNKLEKFCGFDNYTESIRQIFGNLTELDDKTLTPKIGFDLDPVAPAVTTRPPSQRFCSIETRLCSRHRPQDCGAVMELVCRFLDAYFEIFDSDNRQPLLDAYADSAVFSASWFHNRGIVQERHHHIGESFRESRNLLFLNDPKKRTAYLKLGRLAAVNALCIDIPKTTHDKRSFCIDITMVKTNLMQFTVCGLFLERDNPVRSPIPLPSDVTPKPSGVARHFWRSFLVVPKGAGLSIINDCLQVTYPLSDEIRQFKGNQMSLLDGAVSRVPASDPPNAAMLIEQLRSHTKMNAAYCRLCLEGNAWSFDAAVGNFQQLKAADRIPPAAFEA